VAKLRIGSKKFTGCKNGTDLLYHHAEYEIGGDRWSHTGCRRKSVMFFLFVFFVMLWNYQVCDNGNAMKQCNFHNNYGFIAQRKVCSCAPIFNFSVDPRNFHIGVNLYQNW